MIENNKAWDAAEKVRAEWLASFAKGTGKLPGVEQFVAQAITCGDCPGRVDIVTDGTDPHIDRMSGPAALRHAVAFILTGWHARSSRTTWRYPDAQDARMMAAMIAWGYTPGPVERLMLPKTTKKRANAAKSA